MLSGKQKRYLRGLGNTLKPVVIVGKDGLNYNLLESFKQALKAQELVKVSVLKTYESDLETLGFDMAMYSKSELVQKIGRTFLFYKRKATPVIQLPK